MNDIFITNLPGGNIRQCLSDAIEEEVRAIGITEQFIIKVMNVEEGLRPFIRTRVGWLLFTNWNVRERVVELLNGREFFFETQVRTIRMRINEFKPNNLHDHSMVRKSNEDPESIGYTSLDERANACFVAVNQAVG